MAVKFEKTAKNNSIIDSKIYGQVIMDGEKNKLIRTNIYTNIQHIKKQHPIFFWIGIVSGVIGIITGLIFLTQFILSLI